MPLRMRNVSMAACPIDAPERRLGLGDRGLGCTEIADARGAAGSFETAAMQLDDLAECEIPHQARRRR